MRSWAADLRGRVRDLDVEIASGMDGLIRVSTEEKADILVTAIVGMIGIRPTIEAIRAGKDIALANKGDACDGGPHHHAPGQGEGRVHPAGRQRAQRHLPVPAGRAGEGA